jgi:hypothetical protein
VGETNGFMGQKRNVYWLLVGKAEGKRLLTRPRGTWKDNTKLILRKDGEWTELIWLRRGNSGQFSRIR